MGERCYYILAGETSADILAAQLMRALKKNSSEPINWIGIGGEQMEQLGLTSYRPISELSVIGILDATTSYFTLLQIAKEQVKQIIKSRPKAIFTVDTKQFSLKFAKLLRREMDEVGWNVPIIQFVAPTVWAWGAWRAKRFEEVFDAIFCLFPCEPPYFNAKKIDAIFVGHPEGYKNFQLNNKITSVSQVKKIDYIGLLPGSRRREIAFNLPIILKSAELFFKKFPKCRFILPTTSNLKKEIKEKVQKYHLPIEILEGTEEFENSLSAMSAAICVSGTATLQLSLRGIPAVTCYKTSSLNFFLMRLLFKQKDPILPNILLQKKVYPCFLQSKQTSANLSAALIDIYKNIDFENNKMRKNSEFLKKMLKGKSKNFESAIVHYLKKMNII